MFSAKKIYELILQRIISIESAISVPGTSSNLRLICLRAMGVQVTSPIWIAHNLWILNPQQLTLGRGVCIGEDSQIVCHAPVAIGNDFICSSGLYINSGSHNINTLMPEISPINIGNRVWCGMRVTICAGVSIGDDVVIGAGSVVTKNIPSGYLAYGVPAKPVRKLERTEKDELWCVFNQPTLWERAFRKLTAVVVTEKK